MNRAGGTKKRKQLDQADVERDVYRSFSAAANAVSQLYTAAVQQSKRAEEAGARRALERVAQFVVKEYGNAPAVPTAVLMELLRSELQAAQGSANSIQLPFPMPPMLPVGADSGSDAHSDDEHLMSGGEASPCVGAHAVPGTFRRSASGHQISPPKGPRGAPGQLPAMFQQQQQQQQQQALAAAQMQQQQAAALQHQALLAQMQQQQQAQQGAGFLPPGAGFGCQSHFQ